MMSFKDYDSPYATRRSRHKETGSSETLTESKKFEETKNCSKSATVTE